MRAPRANHRRLAALLFTGLIGCSSALIAHAGPVTLAKDEGPVSARCDHRDQDRDAWLDCIGAPSAASATASELFYAGYWLAKNGAYEHALRYLRASDPNDPRVATYTGFALRKLGKVDAAFQHYAKAIRLDPNYNVARAYLGEAYLAKDNLADAERELGEIAQRCGIHCVEYLDLAKHIETYRAEVSKRG